MTDHPASRCPACGELVRFGDGAHHVRVMHPEIAESIGNAVAADLGGRMLHIRGSKEPPPPMPKLFRPIKWLLVRYSSWLVVIVVGVNVNHLAVDWWAFVVGQLLVVGGSWMLARLFVRHGSSQWARGYNEALSDSMRSLNEKLRGLN